MCALQVSLLDDEEILFESERAVITNRRLLANLDRKQRDKVTDEVVLSNVATFKKSNGGQETRLKPGLILLGAGFVITVLQLALSSVIPDPPEYVLFMLGALGILVGFYLTTSSIIRIRPHTSVLFTVVGTRDIPVYFPGKDNPQADEMTRIFVRARRGIY